MIVAVSSPRIVCPDPPKCHLPREVEHGPGDKPRSGTGHDLFGIPVGVSEVVGDHESEAQDRKHVVQRKQRGADPGLRTDGRSGDKEPEPDAQRDGEKPERRAVANGKRGAGDGSRKHEAVPCPANDSRERDEDHGPDECVDWQASHVWTDDTSCAEQINRGEPMHQFGPPITLHLDGPFYVGIGFCSHLPDKADTAVLSHVVMENAAGKVR